MILSNLVWLYLMAHTKHMQKSRAGNNAGFTWTRARSRLYLPHYQMSSIKIYVTANKGKIFPTKPRTSFRSIASFWTVLWLTSSILSVEWVWYWTWRRGIRFRMGGENPPPNSDSKWVWARTQSNLCLTSLSTASGAEKHPGVRRPVNIRVCTAWNIAATWPILGQKNSPENCLVDLETWHTNEHSVPLTCSEERRQLEPELAFWSEFASAYAAQVHSFCASVTAVYLPFCFFGRALTRLF